MRLAAAFILSLVFSACAVPAFAQPGKPTSAAPGASAEQIAAWVQQLDSDQFALREDATKHLIESGVPAVRPLAAALASGSPESGTRALHVLRELALTGDLETEEAARATLQIVAESKTSAFSRRAAGTLEMLDVLRHQRAIVELERLGAKVTVAHKQINLQIITDMQSIEFGEEWKGEEKDFRWLKWLTQVDQIVFRRVKIGEGVLANVAPLKNLKVLDIKYVQVGDGVLEHLKELKGILAIQLYGTAITREGADKLQLILANAKIDLRQGGFLGVGGQAHPKGFAVTIVHPNSAADRADLRVNDVIIKYHEKPIADFEALTVEISKNRPGDKIRLEVLRDEETLMKELTLGEWDERVKP